MRRGSLGWPAIHIRGTLSVDVVSSSPRGASFACGLYRASTSLKCPPRRRFS